MVQNGLVEVRDIGAIACLRFLKIEPADIFVTEVQGSPHTIYYFKRSEAEKILNQYFQYQLAVDARGFARALREIRQEILKNKNARIHAMENHDGTTQKALPQ